jgi:hypothetical protein
LGGCHSRPYRGASAASQDQSDLAGDEIGCQARQAVNPIIGPAIFDRDVSAFDKTHIAEPDTESRHIGRPFRG